MEDAPLELVVEKCRAGDASAWEELVDATANDIYRLAVSFTRRHAEAEDLTQEVYVKLWQNLHQYRPGSSFRAWAYRVARNLFVDAYRKARNERSATWIDPDFLEALPGSDDPHARAVRRERLDLARKGIARIPEELGQLILLRDFADWSYDELAAELDLPLGTVKSRLNRARRELAAVMTGVLDSRLALSPAGGSP